MVLGTKFEWQLGLRLFLSSCWEAPTWEGSSLWLMAPGCLGQ